MLKKLLSYIRSIPQKKIRSDFNQQLEIKWKNGQLILETANTTYSFGKLEQIFKRGLKFIGHHRIRPMQNILNLGLGAGSTIQLLRNEIKYEGRITSVEIDETILYIARKYFNLNDFNHNHRILKMDAFEYVLTCKEMYDLIIIDIFQDTYMPSFLFETYFGNHLKRILNINGFIIFNTILLNKSDYDRNDRFEKQFDLDFFSVRYLDETKDATRYNRVITIKRLQ